MSTPSQNKPIFQRQPVPRPRPAPPPTQQNTKPQSDEWLYRLQRQATAVDLRLMNGDVFEGAVIMAVSTYELTLAVNGDEVHLMKHAMAWVGPFRYWQKRGQAGELKK